MGLARLRVSFIHYMCDDPEGSQSPVAHRNKESGSGNPQSETAPDAGGSKTLWSLSRAHVLKYQT